MLFILVFLSKTQFQESMVLGDPLDFFSKSSSGQWIESLPFYQILNAIKIPNPVTGFMRRPSIRKRISRISFIRKMFLFRKDGVLNERKLTFLPNIREDQENRYRFWCYMYLYFTYNAEPQKQITSLYNFALF